jgi:flavorubredoxin
MKRGYVMEKPYQATADTYVLPSYFPIPGVGLLPINAFVILAKEPVLVDAGVGIFSEEFLRHLESIIEPKELRWVWLTHDDGDHTGSLQRVLELAPQARLATHALAALRMNAAWPVPLERVDALRPGDRIDAGDRVLHAIRPPLFDNPMSIGLYDEKNRALFSVDSFGALVPGTGQDAADYEEKDLLPGMAAWASVDTPWVHLVNEAKFGEVLERVRQIEPSLLLSSHLPPSRGQLLQFLKVLASVPTTEAVPPPNQEEFRQMLEEITKAQGAK